MTRAVIFDLDGTLYDSAGLHRRVALKELSRLSLIRLLKERRTRKSLAGKDFGSSAAFEKAFYARVPKRWYLGSYLPDMADVLRRHFHPREGLEDLLRDLRAAGLRTAVFSDYGFVREKLDALGIDATLFDGIYDAASLGGLKPCRESFLKVADSLGVRPEEALMVGDRTDTDGRGALDSGMRFIHISHAPASPDDGMPHLGWGEFINHIKTQLTDRYETTHHPPLSRDTVRDDGSRGPERPDHSDSAGSTL